MKYSVYPAGAVVLVPVVVFSVTLGTGFLPTATAADALLFGFPAESFSPQIVAGVSPDSADARVDPNLASSPFAGVVSIFLSQNGVTGSSCSGTLVAPDLVLTAGHCVDGSAVDGVSDFQPNQVTVFFNQNNWNGLPSTVPPPSASRLASAIFVNPDFSGFNIPSGVINDDLAMIRLASAAPAGVPTYPIYAGPGALGSEIIMVGYGANGVGTTGATSGGSFRLKRVGGNVVDLLDDDDGDGLGGAELYAWDFDAPTLEAANATLSKPFDHDGLPGTAVQAVPIYQLTGMTLNGVLGGPSLGNEIEAGSGGGDSGGPAFVEIDGQLYLTGVHTFGWTPFAPYQTDGSFGSGGGGVLLEGYTDWLSGFGVTVVVPESSGAVAGTGLGLAILGSVLWRRRTSRQFPIA